MENPVNPLYKELCLDRINTEFSFYLKRKDLPSGESFFIHNDNGYLTGLTRIFGISYSYA
jgi:hypothetical protein